MARMLCSLALASLLAPTVARAQEVVTSAQVEIFVGAEDKAKVGQLKLEVEYLGDTLIKMEKIGADKGWADRQSAGTVGDKIANGPVINLAKPVKLTATLGDTRGPNKHNNCILSFEVRLTTDKGNVYFGRTKEYFFDTDNHGGDAEAAELKTVKGGTPTKKFEITLQKK